MGDPRRVWVTDADSVIARKRGRGRQVPERSASILEISVKKIEQN
jgi:hypothetical protein